MSKCRPLIRFGNAAARRELPAAARAKERRALARQVWYNRAMQVVANLDELARRYVWWQPPSQTLAHRDRLLCQVMQLAIAEDVEAARAWFGDDAFRQALRAAPPGVFDMRSWTFWHRFWLGTPPPSYRCGRFRELRSVSGILPDAQRALWDESATLPHKFVLYGGTGLALRLGHRESVDFDFFSDHPLDPDAILALPWMRGAVTLQASPNTRTVLVERRASTVKVSLFGGIDFGRVDSRSGWRRGACGFLARSRRNEDQGARPAHRSQGLSRYRCVAVSGGASASGYSRCGADAVRSVLQSVGRAKGAHLL